jgi:tRNA (adenine22-N1)-methyltransferase
MAGLSDTLEKIYAMIGPRECVADIGTDHALLPMALFERGVTRALILSDIKKGPLEKARANIDRRLPGEVFDIRLGCGLEPLGRGEADVVIIAGMGGRLIMDILSADIGKSRSFGRYILQPRNASDKLRIQLAELGFVIFDELLATEGRFICEIICASPRAESTAAPRPLAQDLADSLASHAHEILTAGGLSFEISPLLIEKRDPLLTEWLERKIRSADAVSERLEAAAAGSRKEALLRRSRERAAYLRALLDAFAPPFGKGENNCL